MGRAGAIRQVVVGVDGSRDARAAAEWAAEEAALRQVPLVVVHAWSLPATPSAVGSPAALDRIESGARELLDGEADLVRSLAPGAEVEARLEYGAPAEVLLAHAVEPNLVVVGSRGVGRVTGLLLGSVSQALASRATGAVVVVPPAGDVEAEALAATGQATG